MKSKKLAMIFPYAPAYRAPIYELMDRELDVDWYFCGNDHENMKMYDYSQLKHCNISLEKINILGHIHYYKGVNDIPLEQYDIIIMAGVIRSLSVWGVMRKVKRLGLATKIYLWTHGWYGRESPLQACLKKKFFNLSDGVLLYGKYAEQLMIEEGIPKEKLHLIYNSLDYDKELLIRNSSLTSDIYQNHFNNNNPVIVFIGRLTSEKQHDLLLDALYNLKQKGQIYNLVFIGNGETLSKLIAQANRLGIDHQIWFFGACYDEKQNAELIYNADLCVSPGNVGLTAIHTMMFGVPVITHNDFRYQGPEFEAIQPRKTGDFFEKNNLDSLTDCIANWFRDKTNSRKDVRLDCYREIDTKWNPNYQLRVIKKILYGN